MVDTNSITNVPTPDDTMCQKCKNKILPADYKIAVGCDFCPNWFHQTCTKMTKTLFAELKKAAGSDSLNWKCDSCVASKNNHDFNPSISQVKTEFMTLFNKFDDKITTKLENIEVGMVSNLEKHSQEINDQLNVVNCVVEGNSTKITKLEEELNTVKHQMHNIRRLNNLCCLNIADVPVSQAEGYDKLLVQKLAVFYEIDLQTNSIQYCRRLTSHRSKGIPPILVRFASRDIAESILNKYYSAKNPLLLSDVTTESIASRIYINEYLTPQTFRIYRECLRLKHQKKISKVFTRRGNVFIVYGPAIDTKQAKVESLECLRNITSAEENWYQDESSEMTQQNKQQLHPSNSTVRNKSIRLPANGQTRRVELSSDQSILEQASLNDYLDKLF